MEMILCSVIYVFLVPFLALEMQYYKIQNFFFFYCSIFNVQMI